MKKLIISIAYIGICFLVTAQSLLSNRYEMGKTTGPFPALRGGDEEFTLRINEFSAAGSLLEDELGEQEDWIEIFNFGGEAVELAEVFISDDPSDPFKWSLSSLNIIDAGAYIVLFADDEIEEGANHVGFSLDEFGEFIGLYNEEGLEIDAIDFGNQSLGISFGRVNNGTDWNYFLEPTPGQANSETGYLGILSPVSFNLQSGFYSGTQTVYLDHEDPLAEILYTIGGQEPNAFSNLYSSGIEIDPGQVIRAKAFRSGFIEGKSSVCSILNEDNYSLNSMLITGNPDDLFGNNGIYANPYSGLEREIHLSYLVNEELEINQYAGVQIHAPDNRDQKALRLYARSEYGANRFDFQFFEDKSINSFKRLILRNGGNDGVEIGHTGLRDPLISNLYASMGEGKAYSASEAVNVFINGEYWGIYNLRERQDEYFIEDNFGYTPEEVNLLERTATIPGTYNALLGDWSDYDYLEEAAILLDLSLDENYDLMRDWMNIENYVDYQSTEIFICNQDWLSNNMKFWRTYNSDRKWEWILWDTDWGFGTFYPSYIHGSPTWNSLNFALSNWGGWTQEVETELLQNLVLNEEFKNYFCSRSADLSNSSLRADNILEELDRLKSKIENDIPFQAERWETTVNTWNYDLGVITNFVQDRNEYFLQHFTERFELGEIFTIHLEVEPIQAGYIEVNTIFTEEEPWEGQYFENIPVRLKAIPNPGYQFREWADIGQTQEIFISLEGDSSLTALFEAENIASAPVINELYYNPSAEWACGEWIEIFNPGSSAISLANWELGTQDNLLIAFDESTSIGAGEYAIFCNDTLAFKAYYPETNYMHLQWNYSLSDNAGSLYLMDENNTIEDYVNYSNSGFWPTEGNGDGFSIELISTELNNNIGSNWFSGEEWGGSPGEFNDFAINIQAGLEKCTTLAYPNPCSDQFRIASGCGFQAGDVLELYDSFGRKVLNQVLDGSGPILYINLPSLSSAGLYHYSITGKSGVSKGTVLKRD